MYVISERYGLSFLGCVLIIGGTYLFVAFGPNAHEKLKAENIVKHIVGWPVLLYLVRYFNLLKKCRILRLNRKSVWSCFQNCCANSTFTKQVLKKTFQGFQTNATLLSTILDLTNCSSQTKSRSLTSKSPFTVTVL